MRYFSGIVAIVLLVIAVFLGFQIYSTFFTPLQNPTTQKLATDDDSSEMEAVLNADWANISETERTKLIDILQKLSKTGDTITVSAKCQVKPFVLKVKTNTDIKVTNIDSSDHKIMISGETIVRKATTASLSASKIKLGVTRYGCDGVASGYILATQ